MSDFLIGLLHILLLIYFVILMGRMVFSWIKLFAKDWVPTGIAGFIDNGITALTDPPLKVLGFIFRPVRIGPVSIDLAFIVLFLGLAIALQLTQG